MSVLNGQFIWPIYSGVYSPPLYSSRTPSSLQSEALTPVYYLHISPHPQARPWQPLICILSLRIYVLLMSQVSGTMHVTSCGWTLPLASCFAGPSTLSHVLVLHPSLGLDTAVALSHPRFHLQQFHLPVGNCGLNTKWRIPEGNMSGFKLHTVLSSAMKSCSIPPKVVKKV